MIVILWLYMRDSLKPKKKSILTKKQDTRISKIQMKLKAACKMDY